MISVMNECEIDRKSFASADLSFGIENTEEGTRPRLDAGQSPPGDGCKKARVLELDLEDMVSENVGEDAYGSVESPYGEMEMKQDGARFSESEVVREGSAVFEAGNDRLETISYRSRSPSWMRGFQLGDMVWGKVKSHPWWPGTIYNEAFASPLVCRTRREGQVLVTFFGDSSYGWFETDELIPFDPNFPEKSRQTNSRNFVKAVEEAVDEVSRRGALALACRCRNPYNFRPTAIPGYFSVDVVGYEPGWIYSSTQLQKARDNFVPSEMLSFVHQLAVTPQRIEPNKSLAWIRGMAVLLAFRKAVFEEFDETYAQAFGAEPVRPTRNELGMLAQPDKFAPRAAPLSGRLVIAEPLGGKRSSATKPPIKAAAKTPSSSSRKNRYVFKRRDETPTTLPPDLPPAATPPPHGDYYFDIAPGQQSQASVVISSLPAFREAASAENPSQFGNYLLQKRNPAENSTDSSEKKQLSDSIDAQRSGSTPESATAYSPAAGSRSVWEDFDDWMLKSPTPPNVDSYELESSGPKIVGFDLGKPKSDSPVGFDSNRSKFEMPIDFDGSVKKEKVPKRPADSSIDVKKKKKKKQRRDETGADRTVIAGDGESHRKAGSQRRDDAEVGKAFVPYDPSAVSPPKLESESMEPEFHRLLADLSGLALNPFHGINRDAPDVVRHVFLRFRSIVYQKSLPPAGETDEGEIRASKPDACLPLFDPGTGIAGIAKDSIEQRAPTSSSKPSKPYSRPNDPTKSGRKRDPSDRQEEISAKRIKKLNHLKALAKEKKAGISPKEPEWQQRDRAKSDTPAAEPVKKQEPRLPPKIPSPTSLVMKFPPKTTLPSIPTLKVRFGRFGALDLSGTRVYWKSHSCKVLFKYKADAEAAYNHATNNDLFGQAKVNYSLRELEGPASEPPADIVPQLRPQSYQQQQRQGSSSVLLKSILKKPGDEAGGIARESPRVKFMLSGDDGRREPPVVVASNENVGRIPSVDPISKHPRSVNFVPPPPPPPPSHFRLSQPPRVSNMHQFAPPPQPPPPPAHIADMFGGRGAGPLIGDRPHDRPNYEVDISYQMMSLLLRCSEIVGNVKSSLGYVPYHPL